MSEYKIIGLQTLFSYATTVLLVVMNLLLFVTLTRFLTKAEYGVVSLIFITIVLFEKGAAMGLYDYIVTYLSRLKAKTKSKRISEIFSFQLIVVLSLLVLALILFKPFIYRFNLSAFQKPILLALLIIVISPLTMILSNYLKSKYLIIQERLVVLFSSMWMIILFILGWYYKKISINTIFFTRFLVIFLVFIFIFIVLKIKDKIGVVIPKKRVIKKALIFSLPLLPFFISEQIITAADRYIIGFFHGVNSVGSYVYFYSLLLFIVGFSIVPLGTFFPYASREFVKNKKKSNLFLNAAAKYSFMLTIPALTGFFVLRKEIITLLSGSKYISDLYILPFLILFPFIENICAIYRYIIMFKGNTKKLFYIYLTGAITNIVLNLILIPKFKIPGAAIATIISYFVLLILLFIEGKNDFKWDNSFIRVHKIFFSAIIMGVILSFFNPTMVWTKIAVIGLGAALYFTVLFLMKTFIKEEHDLIKSTIFRRTTK